MDHHCHRCGSAVESDTSFCPHCGAPQLRFEVPSDGEGTTETLAQNDPGALLEGDRRSVDWRKAFGAALSIALPVGLLTAIPGVSLGFFLWVVGGAMLVIALYRRRRPGALLDARSGFRIGALTGLLAAYISAAIVAALQLVERYQFHLGTAMDREYIDRMEQSTAMVQTGADTEAQMRAYLHFLLTPDGRATMSLAGAALTSLVMILLAGIGGLLGVRMYNRRRPA